MIFQARADKADKSRGYNELTLLQVMTSEALLEGAVYQKLLSKLPKLVGLPDEYYQALYMPLISNYVEHVQALPVDNGGQLCSMMNVGLARAYYSVEHYIHMHPEHQNHLHTYVLFSAALMRDLGRIACGRKILICNEKGDFIHAWNPFENSMLYQGEYYRIHHSVEGHPHLYRQITPVLAEQIMPRNGFIWISENEVTLNLWFSLLGEGHDELDDYEKIFEVAQKRALSHFSGPDFLLPIDVREAKYLMAGVSFFEWLKAKLAAGGLTVGLDDSMVHQVGDGLFLELDDLTAAYEKDTKKSGKEAGKAFKKLGVAKKDTPSFMKIPYEGAKQAVLSRGVAGSITGRSGYLNKGPGHQKNKLYAAQKGRGSAKPVAVKGVVVDGKGIKLANVSPKKVSLTYKENPIALMLKNYLIEEKGKGSAKPSSKSTGK
jgi:hypothetical protein